MTSLPCFSDPYWYCYWNCLIWYSTQRNGPKVLPFSSITLQWKWCIYLWRFLRQNFPKDSTRRSDITACALHFSTSGGHDQIWGDVSPYFYYDCLFTFSNIKLSKKSKITFLRFLLLPSVLVQVPEGDIAVIHLVQWDALSWIINAIFHKTYFL